VAARLERLTSSGQVRNDRGLLHTARPRILYMGRFFRIVRRIVYGPSQAPPRTQARP
jgi:hypothetical protein